MRLSTRNAIYHNVRTLTAQARTSGAVSFAMLEDFPLPGQRMLQVSSYAEDIGGVLIADNKAVCCWRTSRKWSITTSKHQSWLWGALAIEQKGVPVVTLPDRFDLQLFKVMADRAAEEARSQRFTEEGIEHAD